MFTLETSEETRATEPVEGLKKLKNYLNSLCLQPSTATVLGTKLDSAIAYLEKGDEERALTELENFIECVYSMQEKGRLEDKEVEYIVGEAKRSIDLMKIPERI